MFVILQNNSSRMLKIHSRVWNYCVYLSSSYINKKYIRSLIFDNQGKHFSSLINNNSYVKEYKLKKFLNNNFLENKKTNFYSTKAEDDLFSNVKMKEYISCMKNTYEEALESGESEKVATIIKLKPVMDLVYKLDDAKLEIEELQLLIKDLNDKEMQDLANADLIEATNRIQILEEEVLELLIPEEPLDNTDVTLEVNAGIGGQEAMLFCQELFNMYQGYAAYMDWKTEIINYDKTDIGGLRQGVAVISGEDAYHLLKYEGGIHRVQRVPVTEKSGRIHTSTVSVAVLPQPSEIHIQILPKDLKIETKRASGAGGQHVNTTDSAVRILHIPSGIAVESQRERSQSKNKEECLKKLRQLLYQQQMDKVTTKVTSRRKLQVGTRARSEKIRTYNYPQDRITDHRIGVSVYNLPSVLSGMEALHSLMCQVVKEAKRENLLEMINTATSTSQL